VILDQIVAAFASAIDGGFVALQSYSLLLLAAFATIYFFVAMWPIIMSGYMLAEALAGFIWIILRIGVFYWLVFNLYGLTQAAFQTFMQWGLASAAEQRTAPSWTGIVRTSPLRGTNSSAASPSTNMAVVPRKCAATAATSVFTGRVRATREGMLSRVSVTATKRQQPRPFSIKQYSLRTPA